MDSLDDNVEQTEALSSLIKAIKVSFYLLIVAIILAFIFFLWKSFFVVNENKFGIVLRLGNYVQSDDQSYLEKGLHLTYPYPIDERIEIDRNRREVESDTFWYEQKLTDAEKKEKEKTAKEDKKKERAKTEEQKEAEKYQVYNYNLTGDLNIFHTKWILRYQIVNPVVYYENFYREDDPAFLDKYLKILLNSAVTKVMAKMNIETLYPQLNQLDDQAQAKNVSSQSEVERLIRAKIATLNTGIEIDSVIQTNISPPRGLIKSFNDVTTAFSSKQSIISNAREMEKVKIEDEADVEKQRIIKGAEAEVIERMSKVKSEYENYAKLKALYDSDEKYFKHLYVVERLKKIIASVDEKVIIDPKVNNDLRLLINKLQKK